jgi:hypothetical protein
LNSDRPIDAVIDHAASLQRQVDRLSQEVLLLALIVFCIAAGMLLLGVHLWHAAG